jgi:OTT_1508-like deaminase
MQTVEVLSGSLEGLNSRLAITSPDKKIESWDLVLEEYPDAKPGIPEEGVKKVKFSQHCELTLAIDLIRRSEKSGLSLGKFEIGVSKACCLWCCEYMHLLNARFHKPKIKVRATHGKQPDGWRIPESGPPGLVGLMKDRIASQMDDVIERILRRRRSDSNELPDIGPMGEVPEEDPDHLLAYVGSWE